MTDRPWSSTAPPEEFRTYISAEETLKEFTIRAVILGSLFGLLFGAVSVYVGLRAGLTVSASIPIAVLSISILRAFGRSTILENNIVQTTGLGRRIARRRRHVHDSRTHLSRLRLRVHLLADFPSRTPRRMARRSPHGSAAPPAHRQRARQPHLSRRHCLCRCPRSRRAWRVFCRARFLGARPRRRLHRLHEHFPGLAFAAGNPAQMVSRRILPRQRHLRISRRRLHHRSPRCRTSFCGRHHLLARRDSRNQILRPAFRRPSPSTPARSPFRICLPINSGPPTFGRWARAPLPPRASSRWCAPCPPSFPLCAPASKMFAPRAAASPQPPAASTRICPCAL